MKDKLEARFVISLLDFVCRCRQLGPLENTFAGQIPFTTSFLLSFLASWRPPVIALNTIPLLRSLCLIYTNNTNLVVHFCRPVIGHISMCPDQWLG